MTNPMKIKYTENIYIFRGYCMKITEKPKYISMSFMKDTNDKYGQLVGVMCFKNQNNDEDAKISIADIAKRCEREYVVIVAIGSKYNGNMVYRAININTFPKKENRQEENEPTEEDLIKEQQEMMMKEAIEEKEEEELPFDN